MQTKKDLLAWYKGSADLLLHLYHFTPRQGRFFYVSTAQYVLEVVHKK